MNKLVVIVLGHINSGKSMTWNTLFGYKVKTGKWKRELKLNENESVEVFLVSGSPQERHKYVGDLIGNTNPSIVLCSVQYSDDARNTIDYFVNEGYDVFCQWINPGFKDMNRVSCYDSLGLMNYLLSKSAIVSIRNGKIDPAIRTNEVRDFIYGWSKSRNLIY